MKSPWFLSANTRIDDCPPNVRICLTETGSLTQRLAHFCQQELSLTVLKQDWQKPTLDESQLLNLPQDCTAMIREVVMGYDDRQWMFARSIFPSAAFEKRRDVLTRLDLVPLANILFSDPGIKRENMCLSTLDRRYLSEYHFFADRNEQVEDLWSRRSLFTVENMPFSVQEIFLPDMIDDIA